MNRTLDCYDVSICHPSSNADHVPLAFGLTIAAGLATVIGAIPPLLPCIKHTNRTLLSASLALAAGVMIYVSFTEIFSKTDAYFCCITEDHHVVSTVFCFFGGIVLTVLINTAVHGLELLDRRYDFKELIRGAFCRRKGSQRSNAVNETNDVKPPTTELKPPTTELRVDSPTSDVGTEITSTSFTEHVNGVSSSPDVEAPPIHIESSETEDTEIARELAETNDLKQLRRMGILSCLAIGMHNVPEGLATFVATTADPSFGAALAIAIGLHNIPEGLTVAMPIFYATKSRWKAFLFATISGLAEPVGGFIGWLTLRNAFGPLVYAVCFGFVAGMMIYIAMVELLRLSYKFDSKGYIATASVIIGMFIMAIGLLLFEY